MEIAGMPGDQPKTQMLGKDENGDMRVGNMRTRDLEMAGKGAVKIGAGDKADGALDVADGGGQALSDLARGAKNIKSGGGMGGNVGDVVSNKTSDKMGDKKPIGA